MGLGLTADFKDFHISLKWFLAGMTILMPFWYLSIFFFKPTFIYENEIHIPIILSFCLSICYFIISMFSTAFFDENVLSKEPKAFFPFAIFDGVMCLAGLMYLNYYLQFKFPTFTNTVFGIGIARIIIFFIFIKLKKKDAVTK